MRRNPLKDGNISQNSASEDEHEVGKSDNARLVEEGIAGAEQDHLLQAGKAAAKNL